MPLTSARDSAVEKFRRIADEDPRIIGAFLGGSLAAENADEYSDIDVYYVVKPEEYSSFHSNIRSLIEKLGRLAYFDEHSDFGFDLVLFMFQDGVKGELGLGTAEKMRVMHAGPYKVLSDKANLFKGVSFPYEKIHEGDDLQKNVERELRWYWYWYGIVLTSAARGQLWSALSALNTMRGHVFTLLRLAYNIRPGARVEKSLPPKLLKELGETVPAYDPASIRTASATLTTIVKREIKDLLERSHAEYPLLFEETVLAKYS